MYLRFVTNEIDPDSGRRLGALNAFFDLRRDGRLLPWEHDRADEISRWFDKNLKRPASFSRSTRANPLEKALSWFKDGAANHIARMREAAAILESHGVTVEIIATDRPGYITYDDEHQIVAEPFSDTPT